MKKRGDGMLSEERFQKILGMLKEKESVTVTALTETLGISESTIRRDLVELDKRGLLRRVHGGATMVNPRFEREEAVIQKSNKNVKEKRKIAEYCAGLVQENDFIFIDAGTSTELLIEYLTMKQATYVTNGVKHALKLMQRGFHVLLIGGELKETTEAIIGEEAIENLERYNFTKGFFGANGIHMDAGLTTPDMKEAMVKRSAMKRCMKSYVLADHTKFSQVAAITFSKITEPMIITDRIIEDEYKSLSNIKEVSR